MKSKGSKKNRKEMKYSSFATKSGPYVISQKEIEEPEVPEIAWGERYAKQNLQMD